METLVDKLLREHHQLDRLCWDLYKSLTANDPHAAAVNLEEFSTLIEPHFRAEDDQLFAQIAARDPTLQEHVDAMHREHVQLRQLIAEMAERLRSPISEATLFDCERLLRVLRGHAQKEELLLFSQADTTETR